ncbi:MAG: hypothetical protein JW810_06845 [Sedimentisphaerales bacterium]|nr:hypothetical protein [Sedimentisphaerales bacterium]
MTYGLVFQVPCQAKVRYVDDSAAGANNGGSWLNAFRFLQDALATARGGDEIRVGQGIYKPDRITDDPNGTGDRQAVFRLISGVTIQGGYAGWGAADPNERAVELYPTVLSGDLQGNDPENDLDKWLIPGGVVDDSCRQDNSYTVVDASGTDDKAVLDGVTVTAGHSNKYNCYGYCDDRPMGPTAEGGESGSNEAGRRDIYNYGDITAQNNGAGMYVYQGCPTLIACTFRQNSTLSYDSNICGGNTGGAGLFCYQGDPELRGCRFVQNVVYSGDVSCRGAGMLNIESDPVLTDCVFEENLATGFDDEYYGGGLCNLNSRATLVRCSFLDNRSLYAGGTGGGGLYNSLNSDLTLTDCDFAGNSAANGGAIMNTGDMTLNDCVLQDNSAGYWGGAVFNQGDIVVRFTRCRFIRNSAYNGGGLCNGYYSQAILDDCRFIRNSATHGAGLYNDTSETLLNGCTFRANTAGNAGGGIYSQYSLLEARHCLFEGNSVDHPASWAGGGALFHFAQVQATVANCTFAANASPAGNALGCNSYLQGEPSVIRLTNCICWDGGDEIWNGDDSELSVTYSDIQGGWPGPGNRDVDPYFADPDGGDHHLQSQAGRMLPTALGWVRDAATSPCIDAGDPATPIGWESFPHGGIVNMGAYGGTAQASKSYFGEPLCETPVAGDINGDCAVDMKDLALMAGHWLQGTNQ